METIPLFPLGSVLFPQGRMPLQIFEPRYLDLVSQCLKDNTGFGVVWLRQGSEVYKPQPLIDSRLAQVGSYATIVDWDSLSNGLLGLTIEGGKKFRVLSSYQQDNHLHIAEIEWVKEEPYLQLPEKTDELKALLLQLLDHPHIARLKLDPEINDVGTLGHLLAQLLPIEEALKFELLAMTDPLLRLEKLMGQLDQYSQ